MEEKKENIMFLCSDCSNKAYPNKGKLKAKVGKYAKLKFTGGFTDEYMWVKVTKVGEDGWSEGILDNDPVIVDNIKCGDNVTFREEDIFDIN